ncbi:hypothetical protein ACT8ZV_17005 [Nocardioides sp. MAHUQ-72]|uniref:hypothetical protein n=1 Tax=unclassified Nocardioides TaxID=2615069 RepID=UPI00360EB3FC
MLQWIEPVVTGVLALLALALTLTLLRVRSRTDRELAAARAEASSLRARVEEIEHRLAADAQAPRRELEGHEAREYVITHLGDPEPDAGRDLTPPEIDRALFADLVLRETVVKAASLTHGVRRALAPETRNRIRFEVRREVKRARKQRRADTREARRDWAARQRAEGTA